MMINACKKKIIACVNIQKYDFHQSYILVDIFNCISETLTYINIHELMKYMKSMRKRPRAMLPLFGSNLPIIHHWRLT